MENSVNYREEKLAAISRIIGRIVHDLNNFSTIFLNVGVLIKDDIEGNKEALAKIEMIEDAAERMLEYTRELNDFRLNNNKSKESCDVQKIISEFVSQHAEKNRLNLVGSKEALPIQMGAKDIKNIVTQIVDNAIEASPAGRPVTIELLSANNNYINIKIIDSGRGLNKEELTHIFEPFYTKKDAIKDAGKSLAKAFYTLANSNGSIDITSEKDKGSCVSIKIPCAEPAKKSSEPKVLAAEKPRQTKEVLIVDDEDPLRQLAKDILVAKGFKVIATANPHEALKLLQNESSAPSLLITDIEMPVMDGRELASKLKDRFPALKVLFMSGYGAEEKLSEAQISGSAFLAKPFTRNVLLDAVEKILA
jgi:two-component system cell cycle sensor histidine kinase/response regulator CckA